MDNCEGIALTKCPNANGSLPCACTYPCMNAKLAHMLTLVRFRYRVVSWPACQLITMAMSMQPVLCTCHRLHIPKYVIHDSVTPAIRDAHMQSRRHGEDRTQSASSPPGDQSLSAPNSTKTHPPQREQIKSIKSIKSTSAKSNLFAM